MASAQAQPRRVTRLLRASSSVTGALVPRALAFSTFSGIFRFFRNHYTAITLVSGVILVVMGVLLFTNELTTLNFISTLAPPITDASTQPTMSDPANPNAPLVNRARAYLHTNCSQCHRPGGPTPSTMDLRYTTALSATNACNAVPQSGDLGLGANARLIAPGNAANSLLVNRMNRRDQYAMPPLGSNVVDAAGVTLLTTWVNSLIGC